MPTETDNIIKNLLQMIKDSYDAELISKFISANNIDINALNDDTNSDMNALMVAVRCGNTEIVKALINAGADIEVDINGYSALKVAAIYGYTEITKVLIEAGADLSSSNSSDGITPLMHAVQNDKTEIVNILIEAGVDVNETNDDRHTALKIAAMCGNTEIVKALIAAGANINMEDNTFSPLMYAAEYGHTEIVNILIDKGVNVHECSLMGQTALTYAVQGGYTEIVKILIEYGADVDVDFEDELTTPLVEATKNGYTEIANILIKAGANIEATDSKGNTALIYGVECGNTEIVKALIKAGADIKLHTTPLKESLLLILEELIDKGDTEAIVIFCLDSQFRMMLSNNKKFNSFLNEYDSFPEEMKSQAMLLFNNEETKAGAIKILAEEFNKINANKLALVSYGIVRNTSLKKVAASYDISKLIIEYSGLQTEWGSIPQLEEELEILVNSFFDNQYKDYLIGIKTGNICAIKLAIKKSININLTDPQGDSILHIIVSQANIDPEYIPEIIDLLIKKGINLKIRNVYGKTALDIARKNFAIVESKFDEVVIRLLEGYENNNITGKKRSINDKETNTDSLEPTQNNKFQKVEEQNQESFPEIQNHSSGQEISLSMGIIQFQHNLVQEDQRSNYFSPMLKILEILIPKLTINSIAPKAQIVNQCIEAESKAKLLTLPTYEEPKLATNSETQFYSYSNLLTGIKALDVATDLFKTIYQPNTKNLNIFMIDTAYLGVMITCTSSYLPLVILADMSVQASNGEYEKALIQGIAAGTFMLLSTGALGASLVPVYTSAIISYAGYKTFDKIYSLYSNYGTPEFQLRSNLDHSNLAFNTGFLDWAKGYLNDAEILIREDLELNNNPNSEIQQIALEYDFAGMLSNLASHQ